MATPTAGSVVANRSVVLNDPGAAKTPPPMTDPARPIETPVVGGSTAV